MSNGIKVKRALISVSDKDGLEDLANELSSLNIDILSTGGTKRFIWGPGSIWVRVGDQLDGFRRAPILDRASGGG